MLLHLRSPLCLGRQASIAESSRWHARRRGCSILGALRTRIPLNPVYRYAALTFLLLASLFVTTEARAIVVGPWTLSGPGSTSIDLGGSHVRFTYAFFPSGTAVQTWTATAPVIESGLFEFEYNLSVAYGPPGGSAFLDVLNPDLNLGTAQPADFDTSGHFAAFGSSSFHAVAGETIGFSFGGSSTAESGYLIGSLSIGTVPLPPTLILFLAALTLTGAVARRGSRSGRRGMCPNRGQRAQTLAD